MHAAVAMLEGSVKRAPYRKGRKTAQEGSGTEGSRIAVGGLCKRGLLYCVGMYTSLSSELSLCTAMTVSEVDEELEVDAAEGEPDLGRGLLLLLCWAAGASTRTLSRDPRHLRQTGFGRTAAWAAASRKLAWLASCCSVPHCHKPQSVAVWPA